MKLAPLQSLADVQGFSAHGVHCGLKKQRPDLAILASNVPDTQAAAVFTQNAFAAAPVHVSRQHVADGNIQAIVVNSGNANACTGRQGLRDALEMTERTANALGLRKQEVFVCSTGRIGEPLPMDAIRKGIDACCEALPSADGPAFSQAILTTDTGPKEARAEFTVNGTTYHLGGVAKGSGMIHPNMATMLSFLVTDAPIPASHLRRALRTAVDASFNQISVDGDESTNDTVVILANGAAGGAKILPDGPGWKPFMDALNTVCTDLAKRIAGDGEGATKLMHVHVQGAASIQEARLASRAVARSNLVKAAIHGQDPNWGRIVSSIGSTNVRVEPELIDVFVGNLEATRAVVVDGEPRLDEESATRSLLRAPEIVLRIDLHQGEHDAWAWGCDLSSEYVTFNSAYTT